MCSSHESSSEIGNDSSSRLVRFQEMETKKIRDGYTSVVM